MRSIKSEDLKGKTIKEADCDCVNVIKLTFEDGTELEIWGEFWYAGNDNYLPCFLVDDKSDK